MRSLRPWAALLIGLAAGLGSARPCAARRPFELTWSAPAECPGGDEVSAALARLAAAGSSVDAASVVIVPVAGRWQATLSTRGAQRRLEGESCGAVVQALTVVLALAAEQAEQEAASARPAAPSQEIEPSSPPAPASPAVASASPAVAEPLRVTAADDEPAASERRSAALGWALRMGVLAEAGLLPGPSLGPQAALALQLGDWSLELGAALLLPRHAELGGPASPSSDIGWLGGQFSLCRGLGRHLGACAGAESGPLSGTGSGVDEPTTAFGWWLAASADVRLQGVLSESARLSWQLGLGAAAALARPELGFDQLGVLHRPSAVSGRLFVGLGWGH